jgi:hypothetical protein
MEPWRGRAEKSGNLGNPHAEEVLQRRPQPIYDHRHVGRSAAAPSFLPSRNTMEHIYHVNDHVARQIDGPQGRDVVEQSKLYTILALLPVEADGRLRYRIKSKEENFERIVVEDTLSRFN